MHVGGIRTALFAYLLARQANGQFVLRLEDTDKAREVAGSAEHIIRCLQVLGLDYDEGPDQAGHFGPYKQSDRLEIYQNYARQLIKQGRAYADPYTSEELQALRDQARQSKQAFRYRDHRPKNPAAWDGSTPLRFKSDPKAYNYTDAVMGEITTSPEVIDDFILIKSDGYPTYNFAHIVDDLEMKISHVIRGQEFISSMPNYLNLYDALGVAWPEFAHLPHIMNEQGNKKLGKRDGAKDILDYIAEGYLPETLISFIATLGWNDGTEQEVFTKQELIDKFSLSRVQRSGARFDQKRLTWMNGQFIRSLSLADLTERVINFWPKSATDSQPAFRQQVLQLAQDRLKTLTDLPPLTNYFFAEPSPDLNLIINNKQLKKLSPAELAALLKTAKQKLADLDNWRADNIQLALNNLLESTGQKPAVLFGLIRIAITWSPFSPDLDQSLELIGKNRSVKRLELAISALAKPSGN